MNSNSMTYIDYLNLYYFIKEKNKKIYTDYRDNFHPTIKDIEEYNTKVEEFKKMWNEDKAIIHKPISFGSYQREYKKDNNFKYCLEIGHKFELYVESEFKKYGIDLGMYYDNRQYRGENRLGIEIKHDGKLKETGNVYIEYQAINKDESKFYNSGILKDDNCKYWLIGTEKEYYIFNKKDLLDIYNELIDGEKQMHYQIINGKRKIYYGLAEKRTSKGVVISREKAKDIMVADNIQEFITREREKC